MIVFANNLIMAEFNMIHNKPLLQYITNDNQLCFEVDTSKPFIYHVVYRNFKGFKIRPPEFSVNSEASAILSLLEDIWFKFQEIRESEIDEIVIGFSECNVLPSTICNAFEEFNKHGYVVFTDSKGYILENVKRPIPKVWYHFTEKFHNLLSKSMTNEKKKFDHIKVSDVII